MIDNFLKKVYIRLKELFTQTENPLYNHFFENEDKGFEEFKKHVRKEHGRFFIKCFLGKPNSMDGTDKNQQKYQNEIR